jgi:hypothetical protein
MSPIVLEFDSTRRWLVATASGSLGLEQVITFLKTARATPETQHVPLLFDARGCATSMTLADVEAAASVVRETVRRRGLRAHVALVADDEALYAWGIAYEERCAEVGVRVIRCFRDLESAEAWLKIMSTARLFGRG